MSAARGDRLGARLDRGAAPEPDLRTLRLEGILR